ncbi:hypothetical protein Pfo_011907 [Paulownia fortunei]|nr:hypothetical protein Pfo_011907 [Paulownia fortunei]
MIFSDITISLRVRIGLLPQLVGNLRMHYYILLFQAFGMASGVKSYDENLVGRRVKVWWPKDKAFCEGVVSSHVHPGKNLVVFTNGVEEILNLKEDHGEPVKDVFADQGTETGDPAHASSHVLPEMDGVKDHGEELVGCRVKVWRPKSKTFSEGVVASYDLSHKKHLVVYTNGIEEMLNLRKHIEPADDVSPDQAQKAHARDSSSVYSDVDMDARCHVGKKHKGQSFDLMTPCASPTLSKDQRGQTLEVGIAAMDSKLSAIPGDDSLVTVNGYKVKTTTAPVLEAIFAKYGDIMAHCVYKSTFVRASLLEVICNVVQRLQYYDIETILSDLEVIENEVSDVEASKIKVSWLHEHLAKLRKVAAFKEKSFQLKKSKVKSGFVTKAATKELKQRHAELLLAQEHFKEAEKPVNAMRLVSRKIDDDILESESEEYFWKRRLDDLL